MLNKKELDKIIAQSAPKINDIVSTIKYIQKCKKRDNSSDACVFDRRALTTSAFWYKLISYIGKDVMIGSDLRNARNKIIHQLFNLYAEELTSQLVKDIISRKGNLWVELNYYKVTILSDYCLEFLEDDITFCELYCSSLDRHIPDPKKFYHTKISNLKKIFNEIIEEINNKDLMTYTLTWVTTRENTRIERLEGQYRILAYNNALTDDSLLEK